MIMMIFTLMQIWYVRKQVKFMMLEEIVNSIRCWLIA